MLLPYIAIAQIAGGDIKGQVKVNTNTAAGTASVYLLTSVDSGLVKTAFTDKNGFFAFNQLREGSYLITIALPGYTKKFYGPYIVANAAGVNAGIIILSSTKNELNVVNIVEKKRYVDFEPGKIILNVQTSILSVGKTAFELLKIAPGVQIDNSNNITLNGRGDVLVMVDNKPTYLSNDALMDILQGIQSNTIDVIEMISNPSSKYDAAGTGGIINIKLKRDKSLGTNGTATAGLGAGQPGGGRDSKLRANAGFTLNHRTKALNIYGSYNYQNVPLNREILTDRLVNYNNQTTEVNGDYFSYQRRETHTYRLGADYYITPKQIVAFLVNGSTSNSVISKDISNVFSDYGKSADSTILTTSALNSRISNVLFDLNYKGTFKNSDELNADATYSNYDRSYTEHLTSNYYNSSNYCYQSMVLQNRSPSNYNIYTYNTDYTHHINKTNYLSAGIKTSYVKTSNYLNFGSIVNSMYVPDARLTSQFKYAETINAAYINYNADISKNINLQGGLRGEQTLSDGIIYRDYFGLFPTLQLNATLNADNKLLFAYGRRVTRPRYEDLNPFLAYQDQYTYHQGNPDLMPFYANNFELTHLYKGKFTTTIRASIINGFAQAIYLQNDTTKVIVNKRVNIGNEYTYEIQFNAPFNLTKWWVINLNADASYLHFVNTGTYGNLNTGSPDLLLKVQQQFSIFKDWKAEVFSQYETPSVYGIYQYKYAYHFDAAISKSLFKKQASIQLQVNDIFNTDRDRFYSSFQNLNLTGLQKNTFRIIQLNFTYAFGSSTIKSARKRLNGSEAEQGRASGTD